MEALLCCGKLTLHSIDHYLDEFVHEKAHLDITQIHYVKSKLTPVPKSKINNLIAVNPYTEGLKFLMLAFVETDFTTQYSLYEKALKKLIHIKYYYIEALYFFAKFLKNHTHKTEHKNEYLAILSKGITLSEKHYYRYQLFRFHQLQSEIPLTYNLGDYPFPEGLQLKLE